MEPLSYEQTLRLRRLVARCALGLAPRVEIQAVANELACEGVDDPALIDLLVEHDAWGIDLKLWSGLSLRAEISRGHLRKKLPTLS